MIVNSSGIPYVNAAPAPSAELERTLRAVLATMDDLLDVRWIGNVFHNTRFGRMEGRYALVCKWPKIDARWSMVQSGEVPEADALDIIGWLCEDMQDAQSVPAAAEGIQNRVLSLLGSMDNTRYPWKARMLSTIEKNKQVHERQKATVADMTHDVASHFYRQARGVPQSTGANFSKKGKLIP